MSSATQLTVMTLNVQGYGSFPAEATAGANRLREISELQAVPPDILCVQEGRDDEDDVFGQLCEIFGYAKVPYDRSDIASSPGANVVNQIFVRRGSAWSLVDRGMDVISSEHLVEDYLPLRTSVWVKLKPQHRVSDEGLSVFVYNLHVSGGRYEDAKFMRGLAKERRSQLESVISKFRSAASPHDVAILVGDFNACPKYTEDGPMHSYFVSTIRGLPAVQADAAEQDLTEEALQRLFEAYMVAPFTALAEHDWRLAYDESTVGPTSMHGHLVDHMAMSSARVCPLHVERLLTTNQGFPGDDVEQDTELPITDHNAVKVTFDLAEAFLERSWYEGSADREDGLPVRSVPDAPATPGEDPILHWAQNRPNRRGRWDHNRLRIGLARPEGRASLSRADSDNLAWDILAEAGSEPDTPSSLMGGPGTPQSLDDTSSDVRSVLLDALT